MFMLRWLLRNHQRLTNHDTCQDFEHTSKETGRLFLQTYNQACQYLHTWVWVLQLCSLWNKEYRPNCHMTMWHLGVSDQAVKSDKITGVSETNNLQQMNTKDWICNLVYPILIGIVVTHYCPKDFYGESFKSIWNKNLLQIVPKLFLHEDCLMHALSSMLRQLITSQ